MLQKVGKTEEFHKNIKILQKWRGGKTGNLKIVTKGQSVVPSFLVIN